MASETFFAHRLRAARESAGIPQAALAKAIGIGRSTLAEYESGKISPAPQTIRALAEHLRVSSDYLLGLVGEPDITAAQRLLLDAVGGLTRAEMSEVLEYAGYVRVRDLVYPPEKLGFPESQARAHRGRREHLEAWLRERAASDATEQTKTAPLKERRESREARTQRLLREGREGLMRARTGKVPEVEEVPEEGETAPAPDADVATRKPHKRR